MRAATVGRVLQQQAYKARRDTFIQYTGSRAGMKARGRKERDTHQEARLDSSNQPACLPLLNGTVLGSDDNMKLSLIIGTD